MIEEEESTLSEGASVDLFKQAALQKAKKDVQFIEQELADYQIQMETIEEQVGSFKISNASLRRTTIDEIVYPFINALKTIDSYGSQATINDNVFQTSVYLRIK